MSKIESPNKKIVKKLFRNIPAVAGMLFIAVISFIAVFAYIISPDFTPNANEQFPALAETPPGYYYRFVRLKKDKVGSPTDGSWLFGKEREYKLLPITAAEVLPNGGVKVAEYKGKGFSPIVYDIEPAQLYSPEPSNNLSRKIFRLGSDQLGRDIMSRLIVGSRVSLLVGLVAVLISTILGVFFGSIAGFYRGWVDKVVMWQLSVVWSVPTLLLAMALYISLKDVFESSFVIIFIAIGCTMWVSMARIVRGQILGIREVQFVEAANSLGFSDKRVILKHILPNILAPIIVIAASNFANAILIEAGLSFLGLGIQPPTPSWGGMLSEFKDLVGTNLSYLAFFPGILIMLLVLSFNLVGNGIRDAIDIKNN